MPPDASRESSLLSGRYRLDARVHDPAAPPRGGLVVAHPHPGHGGQMDHPVVRRTCEVGTAHGLLALRFNFRGVGASEGSTDDRSGHQHDWRQALADAAVRAQTGHVIAAGFSYGARTLARLVHEHPRPAPMPAGVLLLAPATRVPTTKRDFGHLLLGRPLGEAPRDPEVLDNLRRLPAPAVVLVGARDVVAPVEELRATLPAHAHLIVLPGLSHFFSRNRGAGPLAEDLMAPALDEAFRHLLAGSADQGAY